MLVLSIPESYHDKMKLNIFLKLTSHHYHLKKSISHVIDFPE